MKITQKQRHWLDFVIAMTQKEIKARYKHAMFGFLWVILNPLLQMAVIGFVFKFFVPVKVDNYFLFLFSGLLPWNFFAQSVLKTTPSIVFERSLIKKAKFPRESIILSIVFSNLFHFLISLGLLCVALVFDKVFFDHYSFIELFIYIVNFIRLIPVIIWLTTFTIGVSLITSSLNVKFRDINFFVVAGIPLWFYATPIVYTLSLLPKKFHFLMYLNPVTAIIESFHSVLLNLPKTHTSFFMLSLVITILVSIFGYRYFKKESNYFDDWV